jgi:hypothetical protein
MWEGHPMNYQVKFFKHLLSSDGHPFKVLQRVIPVDHSDSSDDAVRVAQRRFEGLEHVDDWRLHADCVEASVEQQRTPESKAA